MIVIGLEFMLIGMAVVFFFLTLLVIVLKIVGGILKALSGALPEEDPAQPGTLGGAEQEIAIALAAVSSYKDSSR